MQNIRRGAQDSQTPKGGELFKAMSNINLQYLSTRQPTFWPSDTNNNPTYWTSA